MLGTYSHRFPDFHLVGVGLFAELDASGFVIVLFRWEREKEERESSFFRLDLQFLYTPSWDTMSPKPQSVTLNPKEEERKLEKGKGVVFSPGWSVLFRPKAST